MMFSHIVEKARKKKLPFTLGDGALFFILLIESFLIMGGTLGRYGSTSVENIDDPFFSTIANLTKTACTKRPKTFLKLRRADRGELFTANG